MVRYGVFFLVVSLIVVVGVQGQDRQQAPAPPRVATAQDSPSTRASAPADTEDSPNGRNDGTWGATILPPATADAEKGEATERVYVIEMAVLEGSGLATSEAPPSSETRSLSAIGELSSDSGKPGASLDWWTEGSQMEGVRRIAAPRLMVLEKSLANVRIGATRELTYLSPLGGGKFQAEKYTTKELGMDFRLQAQPVDGDDESVELSPLEIQLTSLDGREPVTGLDLDVGKPIVTTRSLSTTARVKLGETHEVHLPTARHAHGLLLLRVSRAPDDMTVAAPAGVEGPAAETK